MIPRADQPSSTRPDATKIVVAITRPEHVPALAALQRIVFPTLDPEELFTEAKYLKHLELFPEGQFVALYPINGQLTPVAATSTFRTPFDFKNTQHTYLEAIADGWLTNHDPAGEWLYGSDMSVHPAYRGLRIGRKLYEARREVVRKLNLRGEIAGALIPGYLHHDRELTVAQYVLHVWQGKLQDPTLSMQIRNGFRIRGILYDHISDPRSGNCATLIVRENPYYQVPVVPVQRELKTTGAPAEGRPHARRAKYKTHPRAAGKNQVSRPISNQL
ncbi:MAG: GNAT family N-acetyltransferase [Anaerolineae bacterium]|nr:GNAT family N-acetyltransferase [Anaerolineae bacterium]